MRGEDIAIETFSKVLDHVISLGFAVNEHVEIEIFLDLNHVLDLLLDELFVLFSSDFTLCELVALHADLRRC
ncbi:hypothetical protein GJ744_003816 [Endocarpon pusillum]|uniref:Uncharacterized protein n=1 Tax=Endocarpon pusillum TaxID=364733 RepID=A0A8H7AM84_9EURO|nr:hypothetical protein GJ744_003816 [Endocarpon pusillum]